MAGAAAVASLAVEHEAADDDPKLALDRLSMCFSTAAPGEVLQGGDPRFAHELTQFYPAAEAMASEKLVQLKSRLLAATREEFWATVTKGIADVADAQYAFISKRILANDQDIPVEMPPIGEKGSCLMGMAYYYKDGKGTEGTAPDIKYEAYAAPCAYMKHDKVFIIPKNSDTFVPHDQNPNAKNMLAPIATYCAVPLFSEGKCFAHFGVSWDAEGESNRKLSWGFLEMVLHALEDIVLQRVLEGSGLSERITEDSVKRRPVVPHEAIASSQSLKPYARSLSHELRTPMQGVVGMLDVMHATVQEAMEGLHDERMRQIFAQLRENIETVQGGLECLELAAVLTDAADSSRRAVEAADNVVHAYDMNMGVPETNSPIDEEDEFDFDDGTKQLRSKDRRPEIVVTGNHIPISWNTGRKRRRESIQHAIHTQKRRKSDELGDVALRAAENFHHAVKRISPHRFTDEDPDLYTFAPGNEPVLESPPCISEQGIVPGLRHTNLRDVLQYVVNDALRVGGRPDSAVAEPTEYGESIEVRTRHPSGEEKVKIIEWAVDAAVPETMLIDEKDFAKMISCVFLNAVKFTDEGHITLTAKLTPRSRYIIVSCTDSGPGIPKDFLPNLFKPFAREDDSLTRQSEGLGLGLLVARGLARKLRGDLVCVRADTQGQHHGCEFEMRVPITPGDALSRPGSPFGSPAPSRRSRHHSIESDSLALDSHGRSSVSLRRTNSPQPSNDTAPTSVPNSIHSPRPSLRPHPSRFPPHPTVLPHPSPETPATIKTSLGPALYAPQLAALQHENGITDGTNGRRQSTRPRATTSVNSNNTFDRELAKKHPLTFLVAEDNKINRRLLVNMLAKLGYTGVYEAYDGADAVRKVEALSKGQSIQKEIGRFGKTGGNGKMVDVVLMDLWMPLMDGYEATEKILGMANGRLNGTNSVNGNGHGRNGVLNGFKPPTVLAVTADVTDGALERATKVGMKGFMTKPYQLKDLERLIVEYAASEAVGGTEE